jgi:hypothetical protein
LLLQADRAIDGCVLGRAKFVLSDLATFVAETRMRQRIGPQQAANDVGSNAVEAFH